MNILIDNKSSQPIYEQIYTQLRTQVLEGSLPADTLLPSIRSLAKDLHISFITTKRAYEELEKGGYLYTIPGKGCYVAGCSKELLREENLMKIEALLEQMGHLAKMAGLTRQELTDMMLLAWEDIV